MRTRPILVYMLAVLMALGIGAILIIMAGANPVQAYQSLITGSFGSVNAIAEVLVKSAPLVLASLGVTFAYKCNFINLGAEGQLTMGALFAFVVGFAFSGLNPILLFPLIAIAAFAGGVLIIALPAFLKAKLGVNEIILTLMMNYVSFWLISYFVMGPLKNPASGYPLTSLVPLAARFPIIMPGTRLHLGFLISILFVPLIYLILTKTSLGYRIGVVGNSVKAARYGGINVPRTILIVALISGGLAGLAGMNEVIGINYFLTSSYSPGYGWNAIIIAVISGLNPITVGVASVLFSAMITGAETMQRVAGVPVPLIFVIQALLVFFILGSKLILKRMEK